MNKYLKAAIQIDKQWRKYGISRPGCVTLGGPTTREAGVYSALFAPNINTPSSKPWLFLSMIDKDERAKFRLTALCLLSAMHEAGDL